MKPPKYRTAWTIHEDRKFNLLNIIMQETTFKKIVFSDALK